MVSSTPSTIEEYFSSLPEDRKKALTTVRKIILKNLPKGYKEVIKGQMVSYVIPLETYPETYNGQPLAVVSLTSQKNYMSVYMMCVYGSKEMKDWFIKEYQKTGKKLDIGKSCIRFKKAEDLALELIGEAIQKVPVKKYLEIYEQARSKTKLAQKKKIKATK